MKNDLRRDEGVRGKPYKDSKGFLTVGVGHNLDQEGLCPEAIAAQLDYDIRTKALPLLDRLPWLQEAPENVKRGVLNIAFNVGIPKLLTFGVFLDLLQKRNYPGAAQDLRGTLYARQVGDRAERIAELIEHA